MANVLDIVTEHARARVYTLDARVYALQLFLSLSSTTLIRALSASPYVTEYAT